MLETSLYFLHLAGLAIWIGSMVVSVWLLVKIGRMEDRSNGKSLLQMMISLVKWLMNGAALVVLASGGGLIQSLGYHEIEKPLWITLMERGGGMIILLFLIIMTWMCNRAHKRLKGADDVQGNQFPKLVTRFSVTLSSFAVLALAVVYIVSLRVS